MGFEYHIPFNFQYADALKPNMSAAPHFAGYDEQHDLYLYKIDKAASPLRMPDATAATQENGFYLCEYGAQTVAADVRAYLRSHVEASGQMFTVKDLE